MDGSGIAAQASQRDIKIAMAKFAEPVTALGVAHVTIDLAMYFGALAGVLFIGPLWAKIVFSILAGIKLANLGTLGHEAAHGNCAKSPLLNKILGTMAFLPCYYNYRLWVYDHHHIHHPYVNADQTNSWAPFSKEQFDKLSPLRRFMERVYRTPWLFGLNFAIYNAVERWAPYHVYPGKFLPKSFHASAWRHGVLVTVYTVGLIALLAAAPLYSGTSAVTALVLGFAVPFVIWMMLFGFTVYAQHTDVRLPWFDQDIDKRTGLPQETMSLHLVFPKVLETLMHNVYAHAVHHVNVRVPYHKAREAQALLNEMAPQTAVVQPFTFKWLGETLRDCRLYDYENHTWLDFDGNPTGPKTLSADTREKVRIKKGEAQLVADPC